MSEFYAPVDPALLKRERERARALRMDHVVPLGRGGRSVRGNVVPSCKDCNSRKQSLLPVEWGEYLARLASASEE
jgi:5-methylcytosine-specific restriction endonuclease McrA